MWMKIVRVDGDLIAFETFDTWIMSILVLASALGEISQEYSEIDFQAAYLLATWRWNPLNVNIQSAYSAIKPKIHKTRG